MCCWPVNHPRGVASVPCWHLQVFDGEPAGVPLRIVPWCSAGHGGCCCCCGNACFARWYSPIEGSPRWVHAIHCIPMVSYLHDYALEPRHAHKVVCMDACRCGLSVFKVMCDPSLHLFALVLFGVGTQIGTLTTLPPTVWLPAPRFRGWSSNRRGPSLLLSAETVGVHRLPQLISILNMEDPWGSHWTFRSLDSLVKPIRAQAQPYGPQRKNAVEFRSSKAKSLGGENTGVW